MEVCKFTFSASAITIHFVSFIIKICKSSKIGVIIIYSWKIHIDKRWTIRAR